MQELKIVNPKESAEVFSNVEMLMNIHQQFVIKFNTDNLDELNFGQIFGKIAAFLKIYNTYCVDQSKSSAALARLKESAEYENFIKKTVIQHATELNGQSLESFLIKPSKYRNLQ
jgi:hypothetical protein